MNTTTAPVTLKIDFVSDVSCPWCAIGLNGLQQALDELQGSVQAELHFQPFELNPQMGPEGQDITEHLAEKYGASADEVWRRKNYMKGPHGAPCSGELKRKVLDKIKRPDDVLVFGFTAEEADRFEDFQERNPELRCTAPLVEAGIGKADCLAMVQRASITLPLAYRQGYSNANCIGCPKGGEGYWNHVRKVHPLVFRARVERQESIGPGAYFFRDRTTGERFGLKDLDPSAGRHDEPLPACSFFCEIAEQEYGA